MNDYEDYRRFCEERHVERHQDLIDENKRLKARIRKNRREANKQLQYERDTFWSCLRTYKRLMAGNTEPDIKTKRAANGAINRGSFYDLCKAFDIESL